MSESNRNKNMNRWDELAEQLGLPEESRPKQTARNEEHASARSLRPAHEPKEEVPYEETTDSFALTPGKHEDIGEVDSHQQVLSDPDFEPDTVQVETFAESVVIQSELTPDSAFAE